VTRERVQLEETLAMSLTQNLWSDNMLVDDATAARGLCSTLGGKEGAGEGCPLVQGMWT